MMIKKLFFILIILIYTINLIHAESIIDDSIQEQIRINPNKAYVLESPGPLTLKDYLMIDPEFRTYFKKIIIFVFIFSIIFIIDLILRGIAMWKASKSNSKKWFWALLLINSMCILPLIYIFIIDKKKGKKKK